MAKLSRLAYSHFHLFLHLKKHLAKHIFHEHEEVKKDDSTWLRALVAECDDIGIQNFVPRLNKRRHKSGDYVGRYLKECVKVVSLDFVNKYFKNSYCV